MQECEDGQQFIFPGLDRILALGVPNTQALVSSLENARWLLKEEFTGSYAKMFEEHFVKINTARERALVSFIHRVNAVLTVICKDKRSESLWFGC